ncbi:Bacterial extracellular solute-binding protein, family 3 [Pseudodesulfovibrio hydrargyri]|uniref:Bacterial extracellular solute-binding protein, family 3 n=1 Tax=Pseudodesulfovibrio hydrargyri TaxID=2125990 RepID=A0A1J5MRU1_9BACT|nr:transporter substrate-binding domain-containing protein [Pseudodesulfovibrio hydrargyri]OIQ49318.1 Bacterial extracellular solute-binding protein, family 3 [Pseudodesulfovibrio hydrargyri]
MMVTSLIAVPLFVCLVLASPGLAHETGDPAEGLTYLTEEFRPLNYTENGRPAGLSVALLKLIWQEMRVPEQPIQVMPWPRIYNSARLDHRVVIFSMYRTAERADGFKWVGPIVKGRLSLFALRSRHLEAKSLKDMVGLRIASLRDIAAASKMLGAGFPLVYTSSAQHAFQLLESGRVDAIALDEFKFRQTLANMDASPDAFETALVLSEDSLYYAFSRDAPDDLVARFQRALDAIVKRPVYRNLLNFYVY